MLRSEQGAFPHPAEDEMYGASVGGPVAAPPSARNPRCATARGQRPALASESSRRCRRRGRSCSGTRGDWTSSSGANDSVRPQDGAKRWRVHIGEDRARNIAMINHTLHRRRNPGEA